jgi:flagellar motor switch protein FliM
MSEETQNQQAEAVNAESVNDADAPKSEEELLDDWMNMAAAEGEEEESGPVDDRILDQNEIDSLLGLDTGEEDDGPGGIRALLDNSIISYERLPLLEVIFDRFERLVSTSLRQFTADNVDISIDNITSVRFGEYLNNVPLPAGLVVVNAVGLDDYILVVYESRLIYAVVDILLGGRKARPAKIEGRQFTTIERRMVEDLSEVVLNDLARAFEPVSPIKFVYERMEVTPRFAAISREGNAAVLITVRVNLEEREGVIQFCMPYATLEPIRDQLLQSFMGEKFGHDNIWENHLSQELYHTTIEMRAVVDEVTYSLNDVLKWRLGDTIMLNARKDTSVKMKCGSEVKLIGRMGKADDKTAVKITHTISDINNAKEGGDDV